MEDGTERRAERRCNHQAPVTCAYFNSNRFYHVEATNHSKNGISLFADIPLKHGASIYVRVDNNSPGSYLIGMGGCRGIRSIGVAEVKWCREIVGDNGPFFSIGLKYYEPAV